MCSGEELNPYLACEDYSVSHEVFELQQCPSCGFVLTQDHPDESTIGSYYATEDYISHTDTRKGLINKLYHLVRRHMLNRKRRLIEAFCQNGRILDIGAGTGYFLAHMRDHGWDISGLEPDAGAREIARQELGIALEDMRALSTLQASSFDILTLWHVLEHVHDLHRYLRTFHRVLKDDGALIVAVPNHTSPDAQHYTAHWAAYDVPRHLWHFSPESMYKLLDDHGFSVQQAKPMLFDAYYVALLSEKYRGSVLGFLNGAFWGTISNVVALFNKHRASSIIYSAQKKQ